MTAAALVSLAMLAGAWGLLAQTMPAPAGTQAPPVVRDGSSEPDATPRARLLLRNPDGRIWEVLPQPSGPGDRCDQVAGFSGLAAPADGRCTYLRCRWLVAVAECVERFTGSATGGGCAGRDYAAITEAQEEAAEACRANRSAEE